MIDRLLLVAAELAGLLALGAIGYYLLCLFAARDFRRGSGAAQAGAAPPVSLLKPLKGLDPELYESFRSHCMQQYGEYEILFGVSAVDDPAAPLVERLQREFPARSIELVVCPQASGTNRKVGNLAQMLPHARFSHVIVNDSDIRVSPTYLREVMAPFASAKVGMVTAPYRAVAATGWWSRLEALGIATDFFPGVLAARTLEGGIRFGLGSTLAMSRQALEAGGGFLPLIDYLGDDYELGARIARAGFDVVLAREVVETFLPDYAFADFFAHQLRWARTVRDSRPGGFVGLVFTFGVWWSLLALLLSRAAPWSVLLLVITWGLRLFSAYASAQVLGDDASIRRLWMVPLRDLCAVAVWIVALFGDTVVWRGERFRLRRGKLERLRVGV